MLTKLVIRNFKRFSEETIELGNPVVFVGPNDSGKTSALQAIALWDIGVKRWNEKRQGKPAPEKRPGVTINRKDLISIPVRDAIHLWKNLSVRSVERGGEAQQTKNIRIDVMVEGISEGKQWACGLEFDYANEESFYCRPLRTDNNDGRMPVPPESSQVRVAYLPPMSGLTSTETRLDPGAINVRIGEGRTAEVLRNLCHQIASDNQNGSDRWRGLVEQMQNLFGVEIQEPEYLADRGEIMMSYLNRTKTKLDIASAGRGLQQTLLLLAHLASNPKSILLLDEPDAHLEILRQRQIYQVLTEWAKRYNGQIIAASHSEIILNEAADRDVVVAFLGKPHRIDDRGSQLLKALKDIGFEQYYQAEQTGWVLYLEGSTDLAFLQAFARKLDHPAAALLERPLAHYVQNHPNRVYEHFYGLREAKKDLVGVALFDRLDNSLESKPGMKQIQWTRREIENYVCQRNTLTGWAEAFGTNHLGDLFAASSKTTMEESITEIEAALKTLGKSPWAPDIKASDEFFSPLFAKFFEKLNLPNLMQKSAYHELAPHISKDDIAPEIKQVLDSIQEMAAQAKPVGGAA